MIKLIVFVLFLFKNNMSIKIGTKKGNNIPRVDGYETIVITTGCYKAFKDLSPFFLTNKDGIIMENKWQFSKVYKEVPRSKQYKSRWDKSVVWEWGSETHVDNYGNLTDEYYEWRNAGFSNPYAVRYPCGSHYKSKCLYSIDDEGNKYGYIEARYYIYCKEYYDCVINHEKFMELKHKLYRGQKLLIIDVDGPKQNDLNYYIDRYNVPNDFIVNNTIDATLDNLELMLNDPKNPYGHGYVLSSILMDKIPKLWN